MTPANASARKVAFEVGLCQVLFAAMQVYIPWLAATAPGVPLAELAMLSLAQSFVWPLAMVAQLQLRTLYISRDERALFPGFVQLRLAACVLLIAITAVVSIFLHQGLVLFAIAVALALIKSVESFADIMQAELHRTWKLATLARSQSWRCAIFIGVYTVALLASGDLVTALTAALASITAWVLAVDVGPRASWRDLLSHRMEKGHAIGTVRNGLTLSAALALTSLAVMVGRWAALRAGDMDAVAAAALAGTMASIVAAVMGAAQQFSLSHARAHFAEGGVMAFRRWYSKVTGGLHMFMASLALLWTVVAVLAWQGALPFAERLNPHGLQHTVIVLAGFFVAGGWLSVMSAADSALLYLQHRYAAIALLAVLQLVAATLASALLYPRFGWIAIGVAEIVRTLALVATVRFTAHRHPTRKENPCALHS